MDILVIHRYFWPDTPPYASMLRSMTVDWARRGHRVTVFSTQPSYNSSVSRRPAAEEMEGVKVRRCPLFPESKRNMPIRLVNFLLFVIGVFFFILFSRRYDMVMAATTPPVFVAWAARIAARLRGASFVYHLQDIHPESGQLSGMIRSKGLVRTLLAADRANCRGADHVVTLSRDMAEMISARSGRGLENVRVINNFTLDQFDGSGAVPDDLVRGTNRLRVVFAGNLGRFQGLETVIEAARKLGPDSPVEWLFVGEGAAKQELIERAAELCGRTVLFHPFLPPAVVEQVIAQADLGLVALCPGIYRVAYPSKTMSYLACGTPLLALVEADSELARMVVDEEIGYTAGPGDAEGVVKVIARAVADRSASARMAARAAEVGAAMFSRDVALAKWADMLDEVVRRRSVNG